MTSSPAVQKASVGDRLLSWIERVGNKLPEPFTLFTILFLVTAVVSTIAALSNVTVQVPGVEEPLAIKGFFTGEGLSWFTTTLGANYIGFPPLVTVVTILLAIGIAEHTGFISAIIRRSISGAPRWMLPYAVGFIGVAGSILSDSAFVVIPPLAALAFKAAGRHPVAGLIGGFAAAGAGYSTNFLPTSLDALFSGITNAVLPTVPLLEENATAVTPLSNYFFNLASAFVLSITAGFIIDRIVEPRLVRAAVPTEESGEEAAEGGDGSARRQPGDTTRVSREAETRGLRWAVIALAVVVAIGVTAAMIPQSPWRNEEGGFLPKSPLLDSTVFAVFAFFAVGGYVYGRVAGTISGYRDVPRLMGLALKGMTSFLVLAFILGQFIALFNWSGIGSWIAVGGAELLQSLGLTGFGAILLFILLCSILNLFIVSGSSMWTLMAAVFVPMFGLVGFEPAFVQGAFRVGDSATQIITPMNPYIIVFLGFLRRYEPAAGIGTVMARMFPFVIPFWVLWAIVLFVFFQFDIPMGPGNDTFIQELR